MMPKLQKVAANTVALLYSGIVVATFIGIGLIALASVVVVFTGLLGMF
jgi:hypothetical protein